MNPIQSAAHKLGHAVSAIVPMEELATKAAPKKVTAVAPGTWKVMEEISFLKPTWEDRKGFGWADLPYAGGFGFAGFDAPFAGYAAPEFGYAGFEAPFVAPEFGYAAFDAPFYGDFGYAPEFAGFETPFVAPYGEFALGAPFAAPYAGYAGFNQGFLW